jgi:molybdopterin converting factor small subunit
VNGVYTGLGTQIKDGDRIGLFPTNMALIFAEIPDVNLFRIKVKFLHDLVGLEKSELYVKILEGSTLNSIIKKLNLSNQMSNHKILVNGKQLDDYNSVIIANDKIEILPA